MGGAVLLLDRVDSLTDATVAALSAALQTLRHEMGFVSDNNTPLHDAKSSPTGSPKTTAPPNARLASLRLLQLNVSRSLPRVTVET